MDGKQPHILITRLSHIGDCLLTLPLVNAIVDQMPTVRISWAVESPTQQLLSLHPNVHRIISIPKGWLGKPQAWLGVRQQLREEPVDAVVDPQGISKSAALGWLSGAKTRIGIQGRWGREMSPWLNNRLVETQHPHIVDRSIELIAGLNLDPDATRPRFDLPVCEQAKKETSQWLRQVATDSDFDADRIAIINPGGTWASKRWEMDRFGEFACHAKSQHNITSIIVWAGDEERRMANEIHQSAQAHGVNNATVVACPTSLRQLAALESQALFFVGGDTGPLHLANAVGTPCIGLYGTTRPIDSGAYGSRNHAVQAWYQDGTCRERRQASNDAMRDITVDDVRAACDQLMGELSCESAGSSTVTAA